MTTTTTQDTTTRPTPARTADDFADHYSPRNQMILAMHGATKVAGYREWQALGRQVRKGEKGIPLTAPVIVDDGDGRKMVSISTAYVFDVSQTDEDSEAPARLAARRARGRGKGRRA